MSHFYVLRPRRGDALRPKKIKEKKRKRREKKGLYGVLRPCRGGALRVCAVHPFDASYARLDLEAVKQVKRQQERGGTLMLAASYARLEYARLERRHPS